MIRVHRIHSLDAPELEVYRTMRRQQEHRDQGIFVAESDKVVERLVRSSFPVISLLLPERWFYRFEPLLIQRPEEIDVYLLDKGELERLTGFTFYQGVLAVGRVPPPPTLENMLESAPRPRLFAAVEGISGAENLGSLVRNCAAFGVQGLLLDRNACSPFLRRAVRASMGTIFRLPALEKLDLPKAIIRLREAGVRCIAAHPHTDKRELREADLSGCSCVVFGSEGFGLSPELLQACDEAVAIPMAEGVDSLNVGSAAAVFLYEASRQRSRRAPATN